ncbi:efflux RND transporter periplasmic adaptor subunit [Jannaschia aquimarina]|uniref:MdtA_3 protein n=1 Tax=Jannaschia aquimarina TaxID=935700 RepID=A0A0D1EAH0_9RHOB|nr:efflux RND transporter periplasmic adaptor subunit [Jannaschia aquimarina]KIT14694.1 Multidrug resistance protein MdtA precursor [Jannaschia aquimarina]SNT38250.1 membrane fusion protein, multidrug efflux system [Jannaschia aquimarina]
MKLFPVVSAALVCVALFFVVLNRDALFSFVGGVTGEEEIIPEAEPAAEDPAPIATAETGQNRAEVHVVAVRSVAREVPDAVMVRGQTEAARKVIVAAETTGSVVSEPIRKGAFVEAGELLCELDPGSRLAVLAEAEARLAEARARVPEAQARVPEAQARVAEAQARLEEAQITQNAAARLGQDGFASQTRVAGADATLRAAEAALTAAQTGLETVGAGIESAVAGVESAEASVENARLEIEKLTIEAPFGGLLETDTAELGSLLQPGSSCAEIVQLDPIRLVGFLPEAQVDRVEVGAEATARLASGATAEGQVTFLSRSADEMTRTFRVEVTVPNADMTVRDGQTAEILIRTAPTRAHMLPASSLTLNDEGTLGVRVIEDGRAAFATATLIRDTVDGVLLADLPDTAEVIVVGQEYVTDGVPVIATFREPQDGDATQ